jgi:flagellar assembly protein FliH
VNDAPPPPPGNGTSPAANLYARFIPREELGSFAAWSPDAFGEPGAAGAERKAGMPPQRAAKAPEPPKPDPVEELKAARQGGYQDGYRDGLAALENFKQTFSAQLMSQLSSQFQGISDSYQERLESLEQQLSGRLAGVALELARQVVRSEISQRPELIVSVAEEALAALLTSARQICVRLHPDDHAVVAHTLKESLHARGGKLLIDPNITRGGCVIESDIAIVDASVEARWKRVAALLGSEDEWPRERDERDDEHAGGRA